MLLDAFLNLIKPHIETILASLVVALMAIAALIAGLIIFRRGIGRVLDMIKGHDDKPGKGYQYEFIGKDGKAEYSTWTKKDDYYHAKPRNRTWSKGDSERFDATDRYGWNKSDE